MNFYSANGNRVYEGKNKSRIAILETGMCPQLRLIEICGEKAVLKKQVNATVFLVSDLIKEAEAWVDGGSQGPAVFTKMMVEDWT